MLPKVVTRLTSWSVGITKSQHPLTRSSLYISETISFYSKRMSECALTRDRNIDGYDSRDRDNYGTARHDGIVYEHLHSLAGVYFTKIFPNSIKNAPTRPSKIHLKLFLKVV